MKLSRRRFVETTAALSATTFALSPPRGDAHDELPKPFDALKPLGDRVRPIAPEEFQSRVVRAQQLLAESKPPLDALFLAPGTSLYYFSGVRWWPSERLLALVITRKGDPLVVCPAFEEGRLREQLRYPAQVRVWQEDESPSALVAASLADRGIRTGRLGIDETTYFTFFDRLRQAAPSLELVSGDPVTIGCRARKSAHELELMRLACEATFDVFRAVFASLQEGMTQADIGNLVERGFARMKLRGGALVLIGASAALPHGTLKSPKLKEGDGVLIDGGTSVEGYASDVTRTGAFGLPGGAGKPSEKLQRAFEIVRRAQDAALDAARAGRLSGTVDDAARSVIVSAGFGPGYKFFTHRLGHGIGLDGHEHPYLVRGSKTILEPGMTFSNEPGIYVPGDYGLRCEDDMVIVADGPAQLLTPRFAVSPEKPFG
jgi:Xaa-Pro dipeptidase